MHREVSLLDRADARECAQALAWADAVIETSGIGPERVAALAAQAGAWDLFVSLSTASAHAMPLAGIVADALGGRFGLGRERCHSVATGLAEAVANAVLHGNLGLDGPERRDLDGFAALAGMAADRVRDPARAWLRIELRARRRASASFPPGSFTVEVADEGRGYVPVAPERPGGGLALIRACADAVELLDGGRCIRMRFAA